jgi:signal peptidase
MTATLSHSLPARHKATAPAPPAPAAVAKTFQLLVQLVITAVMIIAVTAFLFLAVGPRIFGYQTSTMLTGSMSPMINPGDVVVSVPTPASDLRVGDVITYGIPVEDRRIETHRVIEIIRSEDGTTALRTKGDANNGADPWTAVLEKETVDVHAATIPYLGTAIRSLREPFVLNALMYGAPALLVIMVLTSIWCKAPEPEPATDNAVPTAAGHA